MLFNGRLYGNYNPLDGGTIHKALVDLTGGLGEKIPLKEQISDTDLADLLIKCQKMNSFMGGAVFVCNVTVYCQCILMYYIGSRCFNMLNQSYAFIFFHYFFILNCCFSVTTSVYTVQFKARVCNLSKTLPQS